MKITANLNIELNVTCPHCEAYFDLVESTDLNDEGALLDQACPEGQWSGKHRDFEVSLNCPFCHEKIEVEGIDW